MIWMSDFCRGWLLTDNSSAAVAATKKTQQRPVVIPAQAGIHALLSWFPNHQGKKAIFTTARHRRNQTNQGRQGGFSHGDTKTRSNTERHGYLLSQV